VGAVASPPTRADAYAPHLSLAEARALYFERSGLDPEYDVPWVKLRAGPVPLAFPNTPGRIRAVKLHDLHHVLCGYDTSWTGEAEIAAWELASGCHGFPAAWVLNFAAFAIGLAIAPARTWRAFARGRRSRNLYRTEGALRDALLGETVGAMRERLGLSGDVHHPDGADRRAFAAWCAGALVYALAWAAFVAVLATAIL